MASGADQLSGTEHLDPLAFEVVADRDPVVAGIEDEQRHFLLVRKEPDEAPDLSDRGSGRVFTRHEAHGVKRLGPRVVRPAELAHPLVRPAGNDPLARGVS